MQLAYQRYGAGPPLIILHGLLGSGDNWQTLSRKAFALHFEVFTVDLRNHGRSPHSATFSYPAMVEDLIEFMDTHGLATTHLIGHSMGGKTAMHLALAQPNAVRRLVVVDIAPKPYPPHHTPIFEALRSLHLDTHGSRTEIDAALAEALPAKPIRSFLLKNLQRDPDGRYRWKINLDGIYQSYSNINAGLATDGTFDGPTLFVRGGASSYVADTDIETIRLSFPGAQLATIEGAGHWVHAEKPHAFAEAALAFLNA